eukprot:GEMP01016563.1.p1 GENE.GEMP01016563.1~~GEMP01016563.1.p1  ORF type:complete len:445 (+),score=123.81 GEMP01016563.1:32-1336(+)
MNDHPGPAGFSFDPSHFAIQSYASESSSSLSMSSRQQRLVQPLVEPKNPGTFWEKLKAAMSPGRSQDTEFPEAVLEYHREAARRIEEQEDELARAMAQMLRSEVIARLEREHDSKKREAELGLSLARTMEKEEEAQRKLRVVTSQLEEQRDMSIVTSKIDFDHRQQELERRYRDLEEQEAVMAERLHEVAEAKKRCSSRSSDTDDGPNTGQMLSRKMLALAATHDEAQKAHEAKTVENRRVLHEVAAEQERLEADRDLLEAERLMHEQYCNEQIAKHENERIHLEMEQELLLERKKELVHVQAKTLAMIEEMRRSESPLVASLCGSSDDDGSTGVEEEALDQMWTLDWTLREQTPQLDAVSAPASLRTNGSIVTLDNEECGTMGSGTEPASSGARQSTVRDLQAECWSGDVVPSIIVESARTIGLEDTKEEGER